ncbi:MAG: alpha-L-fucosidase [Spirochaetes bacterium]|nr:alpha-L-fucosidase [Spirochaetota bacterium]
MQTSTDWFRDAKWGVFFHYLASPASSTDAPGMTVDEWNRRIDGFDVDALAEQLAEIKAGYFFITLGQNSGFYLSPNAAYDRIVDRKPSRLSRRDLVADLAAALNKHNIRLMVYFTALGPAMDVEALEKLKCTPPWKPHCALASSNYRIQPGVDARLTAFQKNWEAIITEWSTRWGNNVHGWWIDGGYYADQLYRFPDAPNFGSFAAAMKAGNPDSLVCFNPGVKVPVIKHADNEDYTAGEVANSLPVSVDNGKPAAWAPTLSRFINGAQYHLLTFLGYYWGRGTLRFTEDMLIAYTKYVNSFEGVITWDVPPTEKGLIDPAFMKTLSALGKATR